MWPDWVTNLGPLAYESDAPCGPANWRGQGLTDSEPGVCNHGFALLSLLGNIIESAKKKNTSSKYCNVLKNWDT